VISGSHEFNASLPESTTEATVKSRAKAAFSRCLSLGKYGSWRVSQVSPISSRPTFAVLQESSQGEGEVPSEPQIVRFTRAKTCLRPDTSRATPVEEGEVPSEPQIMGFTGAEAWLRPCPSHRRAGVSFSEMSVFVDVCFSVFCLGGLTPHRSPLGDASLSSDTKTFHDLPC
jgi:hypothetical protein